MKLLSIIVFVLVLGSCSSRSGKGNSDYVFNVIPRNYVILFEEHAELQHELQRRLSSREKRDVDQLIELFEKLLNHPHHLLTKCNTDRELHNWIEKYRPDELRTYLARFPHRNRLQALSDLGAGYLSCVMELERRAPRYFDNMKDMEETLSLLRQSQNL